MSIENVEVISGTTYRITRTEDLDKNNLIAQRTGKLNEIAAHQARVDSLTAEISDIDTILVKLLEQEAPSEPVA